MYIFDDMNYFIQDDPLYGRDMRSSSCKLDVKFNFHILHIVKKFYFRVHNLTMAT